jgi:predicted solute-binding protein
MEKDKRVPKRLQEAVSKLRGMDSNVREKYLQNCRYVLSSGRVDGWVGSDLKLVLEAAEYV